MAAPPRPPLLIVNDEPAVREALEVALAESDLLHTATPGAEACTLLKTHPIGALVLEVVRKVPDPFREGSAWFLREAFWML